MDPNPLKSSMMFTTIIVRDDLRKARALDYEDRLDQDIRDDDLVTSDYFENLGGGCRRRKTYSMAP